eukprot:TRINITY_DN9802_c1_g1_i1.p1 TRINITY_DN9802_c1_g1~~TRINITY_DN9802_c1_g1_i1.p1  ORF type:complete len:1005 (-),score=135.94 TRINITY_DN9802_c1_g1_i1:28-2961(-)
MALPFQCGKGHRVDTKKDKAEPSKLLAYMGAVFKSRCGRCNVVITRSECHYYCQTCATNSVQICQRCFSNRTDGIAHVARTLKFSKGTDMYNNGRVLQLKKAPTSDSGEGVQVLAAPSSAAESFGEVPWAAYVKGYADVEGFFKVGAISQAGCRLEGWIKADYFEGDSQAACIPASSQSACAGSSHIDQIPLDDKNDAARRGSDSESQSRRSSDHDEAQATTTWIGGTSPTNTTPTLPTTETPMAPRRPTVTVTFQNVSANISDVASSPVAQVGRGGTYDAKRSKETAEGRLKNKDRGIPVSMGEKGLQVKGVDQSSGLKAGLLIINDMWADSDGPIWIKGSKMLQAGLIEKWLKKERGFGDVPDADLHASQSSLTHLSMVHLVRLRVILEDQGINSDRAPARSFREALEKALYDRLGRHALRDLELKSGRTDAWTLAPTPASQNRPAVASTPASKSRSTGSRGSVGATLKIPGTVSPAPVLTPRSASDAAEANKLHTTSKASTPEAQPASDNCCAAFLAPFMGVRADDKLSKSRDAKELAAKEKAEYCRLGREAVFMVAACVHPLFDATEWWSWTLSENQHIYYEPMTFTYLHDFPERGCFQVTESLLWHGAKLKLDWSVRFVQTSNTLLDPEEMVRRRASTRGQATISKNALRNSLTSLKTSSWSVARDRGEEETFEKSEEATDEARALTVTPIQTGKWTVPSIMEKKALAWGLKVLGDAWDEADLRMVAEEDKKRCAMMSLLRQLCDGGRLLETVPKNDLINAEVDLRYVLVKPLVKLRNQCSKSSASKEEHAQFVGSVENNVFEKLGRRAVAGTSYSQPATHGTGLDAIAQQALEVKELQRIGKELTVMVGASTTLQQPGDGGCFWSLVVGRQTKLRLYFEPQRFMEMSEGACAEAFPEGGCLQISDYSQSSASGKKIQWDIKKVNHVKELKDLKVMEAELHAKKEGISADVLKGALQKFKGHHRDEEEDIYA